MTACHCRRCNQPDYTCTDCPGGVLMDATDDGPVCPQCGGTTYEETP